MSHDGLPEFHTARDFLFAAHTLILSVYDSHKKGDPLLGVPRSLVNLTFLALEVAVKAHLANLSIAYRRVHDLSDLAGPMRQDANGERRWRQVDGAYNFVVPRLAAAGKIPTENAEFDSLEKLTEFLTKRTFLSWRYTFEHTDDALTFPYFNLYFAAWEFLRAASGPVGAAPGHLPSTLNYAKMPFFFKAGSDDTNPEIVWQTHVDSLSWGWDASPSNR